MRHPRPCKFFNERGFCKYGRSCRFDHRPPKNLRSLVSRMDVLEKENKRLLKVIEDQDKKIESISRKDKTADFCDVDKDIDKILKQIDEIKQENDEKRVALENLEIEIESLKAENKSHKKDDIVFETIITSRKKKWAMKDKKFAERIVQRYGMSMQLMDYFNDSQEIIKKEFLVNADALEEEAEERKISNIELMEAINFFRIMTSRPDYTKETFKQVVRKGEQFIIQEMKKVDE